jgi:DNA-binding transcriptional LysR family regulator
MSAPRLNDSDLRLLRVLDALLETTSVKRAAELLDITPSAVSHSLRELRLRLGDPLLVRDGADMRPTPRATALQGSLRLGLEELRRVLRQETTFEPESSHRCFTLACPDYPLFTFLPALVGRLRTDAPRLDVRLFPLRPAAPALLASGELDLVLAGAEVEQVILMGNDLVRTRIVSEPFYSVLRAGHPALHPGRLDLDGFLSAPHILVSTAGGDRGVVDTALAEFDRERRVMLTVPSFAAALNFIKGSDLIATIPQAIAQRAVSDPELAIAVPPLPLPRSDAYLWWHRRFHSDPGHIWWREALLVAASARDPGPIEVA